MAEPTRETLEERVKKLEQNQKLLVAGFVLVLVGIAVAMVRVNRAEVRIDKLRTNLAKTEAGFIQATPKNVAKVFEAEKFVLRDASGKIRAKLAITDGAPTLGLLHKDESPVAELRGGILEKEAYLNFYHRNGRRSAFLSSVRGASVLSFIDREGNFRVSLSVHHVDGSPALRLIDKNSKIRAALTLGADGKAALTITDKAGKVIWSAP